MLLPCPRLAPTARLPLLAAAALLALLPVCAPAQNTASGDDRGSVTEHDSTPHDSTTTADRDADRAGAGDTGGGAGNGDAVAGRVRGDSAGSGAVGGDQGFGDQDLDFDDDWSGYDEGDWGSFQWDEGRDPDDGRGMSRPAKAGARRFGPMSHPPVLVEMFTSQGCSSCPPADAMLADLATRKDVMALSYHVDYWDYLGWADHLARPAFSLRQRAYAEALDQRGIYTPQVVIAGQDSPMDLRPADLVERVERHHAAPVALAVSARHEAGRHVIALTPERALQHPAVIELVRYAPERRVRVAAGENRGRDIRYVNVVLDVQRLARWDGQAPVRLTIRKGARSDAFPGDTRHLLLVQQVQAGGWPGPILTTLPLD